jgi:hypothetical protein
MCSFHLSDIVVLVSLFYFIFNYCDPKYLGAQFKRRNDLFKLMVSDYVHGFHHVGEDMVGQFTSQQSRSKANQAVTRRGPGKI